VRQRHEGRHFLFCVLPVQQTELRYDAIDAIELSKQNINQSIMPLKQRKMLKTKPTTYAGSSVSASAAGATRSSCSESTTTVIWRLGGMSNKSESGSREADSRVQAQVVAVPGAHALAGTESRVVGTPERSFTNDCP
jgi:hypothetical protein